MNGISARERIDEPERRRQAPHAQHHRHDLDARIRALERALDVKRRARRRRRTPFVCGRTFRSSRSLRRSTVAADVDERVVGIEGEHLRRRACRWSQPESAAPQLIFTSRLPYIFSIPRRSRTFSPAASIRKRLTRAVRHDAPSPRRWKSRRARPASCRWRQATRRRSPLRAPTASSFTSGNSCLSFRCRADTIDVPLSGCARCRRDESSTRTCRPPRRTSAVRA